MKSLSTAYQRAFWVLIFLFSLTNTQHAATCTFTNGGGDNLWHNAANWDAGIIPDADDDAIINSGTLNINQDISVNSLTISNNSWTYFNHTGTAYIGDLTFSGGTLDSDGKIIVTNTFVWDGNSFLQPNATIELAATCTGTISGNNNRNLYGELINYGTCTHTGGTLRFQTGGSVENYGTYTVDGADLILNTGGGSFTNNGVFNKNNSNSLSLFAGFDQAGTGQLNVNEGTIILLSGGSNSGTSAINIASGALLNISSGTYTFTSGTSISGSGDLKFAGGTSTLESAFNLSGETEISGGVVNFNDTDTTYFAELTMMGGTLQGSSPLKVSSTFNWTGTSTIQSTNSLKLAASASGTIYSGGSKNLYSILINDGTISHTGGNFRFYPGGSLQNNGTYTSNGPTNIYDNGGGSFDNNGFFDHQKNSSLNFQPDFNNNINGAVKGKSTINFSNLTNLGTFIADAGSGTLNLTGDFDAGKGLEIGFDNANHGDIIAAGDITLSGNLDVSVIGNVPMGNYTILSTSSGTLSGTFATTNIPSDFSIQYTATEVVLSAGVLPVELTKFDAVVQRDAVLLQWQTQSEFNSDNFFVEHSTDGQNFITIGEITAAGISSSVQDYHFIHETPENGQNYYRLRQQNLDRSFEYSDLRVVSYYDYEVDLQVFPNPSHGLITINNHSDKTFSVSIKDLSGRVVFSKAALAPGEASLDLRDLHKAMYILEITEGYYTYTEKLMILE